MIQLEDFPEHLRSITTQQWEKLFSLIPEIESTEVFGGVVESLAQRDGSITFPHRSEAEIVARVGKLLYSDLNLLPVYDWTKWEEAKALRSRNIDFNTIDIVTLCKLLTSIYRADRFSGGHLVSMFQQGIMLKILKALQYHIEQGNLPKKQGWFTRLFK